MKLKFEIPVDRVNAKNSENGVDTYIRKVLVQDVETEKLIREFPISFTLDTEKQLVDNQSLIFEKAIAQINKYITCYELMLLRNEIAFKQLGFRELENKEMLAKENLRMADVQKQLKDNHKEYQTLLKMMTVSNVGVDDISCDWILREMMDSELLYQESLYSL